MNEEVFLNFVAKTLNKPVSSITLESDVRELGWDSLCDLEFLAEADEAWGVPLDVSQLSACRSGQDFFNLLG